MDKKRQYQALISDVKDFYKKQVEIHKQEPVYLTWYDDCEEINLWTYWQGRGNLDAKILLVGQDWGSLESPKSYMAQFKAINAGETDILRPYGTSITDNRLTELFASIGYKDIINNHYSDLFFTNYVLGYRNKGLSGHFKSRWLRENKEFFRRLANIIEPNIIICLGRTTLHGVMMAFDRKIAMRSYNSFIISDANPVSVHLASGKKAYVFAQAHCGAMGTLNRNRLEDPEGRKDTELQKHDWSRMKPYLSINESPLPSTPPQERPRQ